MLYSNTVEVSSGTSTSTSVYLAISDGGQVIFQIDGDYNLRGLEPREATRCLRALGRMWEEAIDALPAGTLIWCEAFGGARFRKRIAGKVGFRSLGSDILWLDWSQYPKGLAAGLTRVEARARYDL